MRTLVVLLAACGPKAGATIQNEHAGGGITVAERGVGVLDARTHVTLASMRGLFPDYEVTAEVSSSSTIYNVMNKGDKLLYVVANDDGSLFGVHVTSGSIPSPGHGWRVGGKLRGGVIDACDCWGTPGDEVTTCFKTGEHVAVVFELQCSGMFATPQQREHLVGATISRVVWQPKPWQATANNYEGM